MPIAITRYCQRNTTRDNSSSKQPQHRMPMQLRLMHTCGLARRQGSRGTRRSKCARSKHQRHDNRTKSPHQKSSLNLY